MNIRDQFKKICDGAEALDEANGYCDCTILEPYYQSIIALGEEATDKSKFIDCLIEVVNGEIVTPATMLPYVMRYFKFPEVMLASVSRLGDPPNPRYMNFHSDLVHAIKEEQWKDADLWKNMQ